MDDLGLHHQKAHSTDVAVLVEMLAEDYEAAEREARHAYAVLAEMGDLTYQASEGLLVAGALERQGRTDEAEEWLAISNSVAGSPDDPDALVVQARLLARRGRLEEAIDVAQSALDRGAELPVPRSRRTLHARGDPPSRGARRGGGARLPNGASNDTRRRASSRSCRRRRRCSPRSGPEVRPGTARMSGEADASPSFRRSCDRPRCTS